MNTRTHVAETRLFSGALMAKKAAKIGWIAPRRSIAFAKRLKTKDRGLAERVGFVPGEPAHINNLGPFATAQIARNAQDLSIRYKTGTAESAIERFLVTVGGTIVYAYRFFVKPLQRVLRTGTRGVCQ